jgi:hypothetical protein
MFYKKINLTIGLSVLISSNVLAIDAFRADAADIMIGLNDGRDSGRYTENRAMVHGWTNDELWINFDGDFEGGTHITSNLYIQEKPWDNGGQTLTIKPWNGADSHPEIGSNTGQIDLWSSSMGYNDLKLGWLWYEESYQHSDIKLKENIKPLENSLEKVMALDGKNYNLKNDVEQKTKIGLIAQDVEKVLPELVSNDDKGIKAVNYISLIPVLIEAIKTQQVLIEQQNQRIKVLENKK